MQLEYFLNIRQDSATLIPLIEKECKSFYEWKAFKQYYPKNHDVFDRAKRQDKRIQVPDPNSTPKSDGTYPTQTKIVKLNRIGLALQKLIVSRKTAFVTGGDVLLKAKAQTDPEKNLFEGLMWTWRNNKLQYKNADIFKRMVSETECAEIWYSKVNEDKTVSLRCNIYSPSKGYTLTPVFDAHEDLIAFGLGYCEVINGKEVKCYDIYDNDYITKHIQVGGTWTLRKEEGNKNPLPNPYGKIPVIYYQSRTAWEDVQPLIERLETLMSNFGDVNDYNGSPILFAEGEIEGFSEKGESGKVIQGKNGAKISYVSWDHAPESIKLEIESLENYIYTITQTPNISFKEMKGLGQATSGVAIDRIYIDAHLNAKDYQNGKYGEGIQRRINFLKTALTEIDKKLKPAIDMEITPEFKIFSVDSDLDRIETAMKANGNMPVMSQKESIIYTGLSDEPETTLKDIKNQNTVTN